MSFLIRVCPRTGICLPCRKGWHERGRVHEAVLNEQRRRVVLLLLSRPVLQRSSRVCVRVELRPGLREGDKRWGCFGLSDSGQRKYGKGA